MDDDQALSQDHTVIPNLPKTAAGLKRYLGQPVDIPTLPQSQPDPPSLPGTTAEALVWIKSAIRGSKKCQLIEDLKSNYIQARDRYLYAISAQYVPDPLAFPLSYFYARNGKKDRIFSFMPFSYHQFYSIIISKKTFPAFLQSCGLPPNVQNVQKDQLAPIINALFEALLAYIQDYPFNERDKLMQEMLRVAPISADFFGRYLYVSPEQNLLVPREMDRGRGPRCRYIPLTAMRLFIEWLPDRHRIEKSILMRYLTSVIKMPHPWEDLSSLHEDFHANCILYSGYDLTKGLCIQSVSYDSGFVCQLRNIPHFPSKVLPYASPPDCVPSGAAHVLFHLTGGNTELLDKLARLLARAACPVSARKNMTVLCTRENPEQIQTLIREMLLPIILTGPAPSKRSQSPLPSLNQFCRVSGLRDLYNGQGAGQGVVFVRDLDVSDTALPILKKLLTGKRIQVQFPDFLKQNLYCRTHFICLSQDTRTAQKLSKALNVELLDLTPYELPIAGPLQLSPQDVDWLRSVFLPYGLVEAVEKKTAPQAKQPSASSYWVSEFLTMHCTADPDARCDRDTLYRAYCAFYCAAHPGQQPPLTQGRFVKAVRALIGRGHLKTVCYQKLRQDQRRYFVGLSCPTELPEPATVPLENIQPENVQPDEFTAHLDTIHRSRPKITLQPSVHAGIISP